MTRTLTMHETQPFKNVRNYFIRPRKLIPDEKFCSFFERKIEFEINKIRLRAF